MKTVSEEPPNDSGYGESSGETISSSSEGVDTQQLKEISLNSFESNARWVDNKGEEVEEVFGFNSNAELVNGRAAMFGFLMLLLTELVFNGAPVTRSIFGIGAMQ